MAIHQVFTPKGEFYVIEHAGSYTNDRGQVVGTFHNPNGPAMITDKVRKWFVNGFLHRVDGPAVEFGITVNREFIVKEREYYQDGLLHRVDGPALIGEKKEELWYLFGEYHRIGGPAVKYKNGYEEWYKNGFLHRTDGPAVNGNGVEPEFWIDGEEYTETKFRMKTSLNKVRNILFNVG